MVTSADVARGRFFYGGSLKHLPQDRSQNVDPSDCPATHDVLASSLLAVIERNHPDPGAQNRTPLLLELAAALEWTSLQSSRQNLSVGISEDDRFVASSCLSAKSISSCTQKKWFRVAPLEATFTRARCSIETYWDQMGNLKPFMLSIQAGLLVLSSQPHNCNRGSMYHRNIYLRSPTRQK